MPPFSEASHFIPASSTPAEEPDELPFNVIELTATEVQSQRDAIEAGYRPNVEGE